MKQNIYISVINLRKALEYADELLNDTFIKNNFKEVDQGLDCNHVLFLTFKHFNGGEFDVDICGNEYKVNGGDWEEIPDRFAPRIVARMYEWFQKEED